MKRIVSLFVVLCMLISIIPATGVAAVNSEKTVYNYIFNRTAIGASGNVSFSTYTQGGYSYDSVVTGDPWEFVGMRSANSHNIASSVFYFQTKTANKDFPNAGFVFKIKVEEPGRYSPQVTYVKRETGPKMNVFIVDTDTLATYDMTSSGGIRDAANFVAAQSLGTLDAYFQGETTETSEIGELSSVKLDKGEYYLMFVINGINANTVPTSGTAQYRFDLKQLTLTEEYAFEYITGKSAIKPELISDRGLLETASFFTEYGGVNTSVSDDWAFNSYPSYSNVSDYINTSPIKIENYNTSSQPFLALKLNIGATGKFDVNVRAFPATAGTKATVYMFPTGETAKVKRTDFQSLTPIGTIDTQLNPGESSDAEYSFVGKTNITSSGDYYIVFDFNSTNPNQQSATVARHSFLLAGIKLTEAAAEDEPEKLSLKANKSILDVGDEETLVATATYSLSGTKVMNDGVTYISNDKSVVDVSSSGVVSAKGEGKATVTATIDGTDISDSVEFTVLAPDPGNAGKIFEYIFSTNSMLDQTVYGNPRLDASGTLRQMSDIDSFDEIDSSKSAPWAYAGFTGANINLGRANFNSNFDANRYGTASQGFLAVKINVPNKGDYNLFANHEYSSFGTAADVYVLSTDGVTSINRDSFKDAARVGHFDTRKTDTSPSSGEQKIGKVSFAKRGDYYVIIDCNSDNPVYQGTTTRHYLYLNGIKLTACPGDFDKVRLALEGVEAGEPVVLATAKKINAVLTDVADMPLDEIDEDKLSVNFTSSDDDVIRINDGWAEAVSCGSAKIIADVTYDGISREAEYEVTVTPLGENLLSDNNPTFEEDEWIWNWTREDEEPAEAKFMRTMLGVAPTEDNPNNRAMGVVFNPNVAAHSNPADIAFKTGKRIKLEPGKIYQLSFKYKIENYKIPEDASDMSMIFNLYAYPSQSSGSAVSTFTRTTNFAKDDYIEKFSEWQEVVVAISAPNVLTNPVYATPRLVFRPTSADLEKAGYEGIAWFDDFELREVGFAGVNVEVVGDTATGNKTDHTIYAIPYATTGNILSLDDAIAPECAVFETSDSYVISNPKKYERTLYKDGSGDYVVSATSTLGGMNGSADIIARITLGAVTHEGRATVKASNFPIQLYRIESDAESIAVGENTKVNVTGYLTDGTVAELSGAIWEFKSLTPDIVSVSSDGNVTALRAGKGKVNVAVLNGSIGAETICEITVSDESTFESVELSGAETVPYLRDVKLTLKGKMSSEYDADVECAKVKWNVTSNPSGGITISDDGVIFGAIEGAIAEIYADVTIGDVTLRTNIITVTVSESTLLDFMIDFGATKETVPADVKIEVDGWEFNKDESHSSAFNAGMRSDGVLSQTNGVGRALAIDVFVPYEGIYNIIFTGQYYIAGTEISDVYIDGTYAGEYEFYKSGANRKAPPKSLRTMHLDAGVHTFAFVPRRANIYSKSHNQFIMQLRFAGVEELPELHSINVAENITVAMNETKTIDTNVIFDDGFVYSGEKRKDGANDPEIVITYSEYDETILKIENDGTITPVNPGETDITVKAFYNGEEVSETTKIIVVSENIGSDTAVASVKIVADRFVMSSGVEGITLEAAGFNASGESVDISNAEISWLSSDEGIVTVTSDGFAAPVSVGVADVMLAVVIDGNEYTYIQPISVRDGKVSRTYYTDEMVEAAAENSQKYSWAADIKKTAIRNAEKYLGLEETLWNMVTAENIPRAITVGLEGDPDRVTCRYCGVNLHLYGNYPWTSNPIARPWKIQCGACKRQFPTNDFAKLYELGKNENGIYEVELARERNAALVEETNGEVDYLRNNLYPELAGFKGNLSEWETVEGWGVDDGLGYDTGRVYSNGIAEMHTYIAYYNHFGLWYTSGSAAPGVLQAAANALSEAYIYTGEEKYGRVGAILIDRIADVYPGYDGNQWAKYTSNEDSSDTGKILGRIWECMLLEDFAIAYDAFFPMYDDPRVVSFLAEKAEKYMLDNDKTTPEKIRNNIETGLLREIGKAAGEARISGNFGMHQSTVTAAAVILDTQPYTNEMIDWVFKNAEGGTKYYSPGGDIGRKLINDVSRDGQGTESAAGYNSYWVTDIVEVAYTLGRYDEYDGVDFWNHPKYIQMIKSWAPLTLTKRGLPSIGDSGTYASFRVMLNNPELMLNAYAETGDIEIAQHLYNVEMYTNGTIDNLHYNIFKKNPESIRAEIKRVIEKYGEYDYSKSSMLTGYGFAALRDGQVYENAGTSGVNDTMRDFWMYFGGATSHKHNDMLNIGIEAYGICLTPDLGYPEATGTDPNRHQWQNNTLSHNAVLVNEQVQLPATDPAKPLHYEQKDTRVKVIDASAPEVYTTTDEYRRSVVMIDYDDEISYGIDFFNVRGGNDHLYSFHASSNTVSEHSDNLDFYVQPGGTYASVSAPYGPDPYTNEASTNTKLKYPTGYTWLENVRRADNPGESDFFVDWQIKDIQNHSRNPKEMDIHLRLTMVNDFNADEVTLATGLPPRSKANLDKISHLEYMLVRRKGNNLNTLFTTVLEPYNGNRYIKSIEAIPVTVVSGTAGKHDLVKAVKVTMNDGRVDYIVYAQNKNVVYNVGDKFEFSGFVGVYSENAQGENIYTYLHDGTKLAELETERASVTGKVVGFQKELSFDNWIDVSFDEALSESDMNALAERLMNVEHKGLGNASYVIESVQKTSETTARLYLGNITLIDKYIDSSNEALGYIYDISEGNQFEIPLSYECDESPVFGEKYDSISTSAGRSVSVRVNATASEGEVSYAARTLPRGASFDVESATLNWKPDSAQIGENLVAIDATDEQGRKTTLYFTITVYGSTGGGSGGGGGAPSAPGTTTPTIPATKPDSGNGNAGSTPEAPQKPSTPTVPEVDSNIRFIDIGNHGWAVDAINALADEGIIKGTSENTFSPAANITRADFAVLLVRAFKLASENEENFTDVLSSDYFAKELAVARNTGLVNGIGDNKFAPRNNITRQDMMVIVYRALVANEKLAGEINESPAMADFETVADYAKEAVEALVNAKLVNGKNGLIAPNDYTTRAEVAVLIERILSFIN